MTSQFQDQGGAPSSTVTADARVTLNAIAHDDALRTLPGARLVWLVDGRPVTRGSARSVGGPRPGRHLIVAQVRDGRRRIGRASVRIRVQPVAPRLILRAVPAQVPTDARSVRLRLAATVPAVVSVSGPSVAVRTGIRLAAAPRTVVVALRRGSGPVQITLRASAFGRASNLRIELPRK